jgi:hypothetical protein
MEVVVMSASVRELRRSSDIELGTGVSWPLVYAAGGLGLVVLAVGLAFGLLYGKAAAPADDQTAALRNAPRPSEKRLPSPAPIGPALALAQSSAMNLVPEPPELLPAPSVIAWKPFAVPVVPQPVAVVVADKRDPVTVPEPVKTPPVATFKRRFPYDEYELISRLSNESRDLDLEADKGATAKLLDGAMKARSQSKDADKSQSAIPPILELIARRDDLKGLPVRNVADCQVEAKEAKSMKKMSATIRALTLERGRKRDEDASLYEKMKRDSQLAGFLAVETSSTEWRGDVGVRILEQMIQPENEGVRQQLIKSLAATKGKTASTVLVRRAVFDLSPAVREAALKALKDRPAEEYRPALLESLCYPWAPVADHAAEALVALDDQDAVFDLILLLSQPDPQAPSQNKENKWVAPELVRVNHLGNCLLCHAPSTNKDDPVRGVVPQRGEELPPVYYESKSGDFIRADVTYLKQDFSLLQSVAKPDKWPRLQRFDYLIRQRELRADEVQWQSAAKKSVGVQPASYPQRESVLWALRELTGEDAGDRTEDWHRFFVARQLLFTP